MCFVWFSSILKLVTVEINPQGRIFVENLGVFVFRVWSSEEKEVKKLGD